MRVQNKRVGLRNRSAGHGRGFFLTLLVVLHQANSVSLMCPNKLSHQHCSKDSDGVHDLDCFGKLSIISPPQYYCRWRPGHGPSVKTYTLLIRQAISQKSTCIAHTNITGTSASIRVYKRSNISAELFESSNSGVCTKALFQGLARKLLRCGPPDEVFFGRFAGTIAVNVTWQKAEMENIIHFAVRYRAQGSWRWSESLLQSENATAAMVSVNSSLAYTLQVRCVSNAVCSQCTWSREYDVPPELTAAPDLDEPEDGDAADVPGCRRLSLTWKFSSKNAHDGYKVTIGKASGEAPREVFRTTEPSITFILSYSSYHLEISAFNNASTSPALRHTIRRREDRLGFGAEEPRVTVHSNRSFTISLRDNLMGKYVCYSAEWMEPGHKAASMSYYSQDNSRTLTLKRTIESLEPYRRYSLTVHVRPDKDTCNMKRINNSESTYGSTHFYFMEGSPVGAPTNVNSSNVTLDSAVLQWSSIPDEDARGFLLGYVIYYTEYQNGTRTEKNVTVNPDVNSHTLEALKSGTTYEVQISGFTRAGAGVRSEATAFTTDHHDNSPLSRVIKFAAIMTSVLLFGSPIIKRAKKTLWPSIPNPRKSNMMQKMEMTNELERLQSISTLRVEEWDTDSLQIVQKEEAISARISAEMPSLLDGSEDDFGDVQETQLSAAPLALAGGYTTVEMFRQAVSASTPVSQEREPEMTVLRSQLDYVRQFSTDSTWDNQTLQGKQTESSICA